MECEAYGNAVEIGSIRVPEDLYSIDSPAQKLVVAGTLFSQGKFDLTEMRLFVEYDDEHFLEILGQNSAKLYKIGASFK